MSPTIFYVLLSCLAILTHAALPNECTITSRVPGALTSTISVTSTYCPVCDAAKQTGGVYTTTYATVYASLCPTGLIPATYTVTALVTGSATINEAIVPNGFTTTTLSCTVCGPSTSVVTITQPIATQSAFAHSSVPIGTQTAQQPNSQSSPATLAIPGGTEIQLPQSQSVTPAISGVSDQGSLGHSTSGASVSTARISSQTTVVGNPSAPSVVTSAAQASLLEYTNSHIAVACFGLSLLILGM